MDTNSVYKSDVIVKVRAPSTEEIPLLNNKSTLISFVYPAQNPDLLTSLKEKQITLFGMDTVPRISRAQVVIINESCHNCVVTIVYFCNTMTMLHFCNTMTMLHFCNTVTMLYFCNTVTMLNFCNNVTLL